LGYPHISLGFPSIPKYLRYPQIEKGQQFKSLSFYPDVLLHTSNPSTQRRIIQFQVSTGYRAEFISRNKQGDHWFPGPAAGPHTAFLFSSLQIKSF
jgi:hypothetical protein